jgi:hypothetical protein
VPDSQAGNVGGVELRPFSESSREQNDSADQSHSADNRGNRNVLMLIGSGMNRADIKNSFTMGVREPLIGEGEAAQQDEENAAPNKRFHGNREGS